MNLLYLPIHDGPAGEEVQEIQSQYPNLGAGIFGPPQACDVDGDGFIEFFVNDDWRFVHRIGHDGFTVYSVPSGNGPNNAQPTIADADQDGEFELLFLGKDGKIHCLSARTGSERWQSDVGVKGVAQPVVVMDVNRDREYELIVWGESTADGEGLVVCASFWGYRIWSWDLPESFRMCRAAFVFFRPLAMLTKMAAWIWL